MKEITDLMSEAVGEGIWLGEKQEITKEKTTYLLAINALKTARAALQAIDKCIFLANTPEFKESMRKSKEIRDIFYKNIGDLDKIFNENYCKAVELEKELE